MMRLTIVKYLTRVVSQKTTLASLDIQLKKDLTQQDAAFAQELCYGVLRHYPTLAFVLTQLLEKPLKTKDKDLEVLLMMGLYQLHFMRVADHAAIFETVSVVNKLNKQWAKAMVNGVLRRAQRDWPSLEASIAENDEARTAHPKWLLKRLQKAWPAQWPAIVEANNGKGPMVLRVNARQYSVGAYLELLTQAGIEGVACVFAPEGIRLVKPVSVELLPGFFEGAVSIQDEAAQWAADILSPVVGAQVLDTCAAPGGKTCHLLEKFDIELTSVELEPYRAERIQDNLNRLHLTSEIICHDAADISWATGRAFTYVMLDVPCSATGVIRRNPDIKCLRTPEQLEALVVLQRAILVENWKLLPPGGHLLYITCSVLPIENEENIAWFLAQTPDAQHQFFEAKWGEAQTYGRQHLPMPDGPDGFYYCLLKKSTV